MDPILIIGSGQAGYSVAREFRRVDAQSPLLIVTADDGAFYSKPRLSNAFAQGQDADSLVANDAESMAAKLGARVLTSTPVQHLDADARTARIGQDAVRFSHAVLAWGARQRPVPLSGSAAGEVVTVNSRQDYAGLRRRLESGERVLIMGAGLIGCEFANDLAQAGFRVTVVDPAPWPLPRLLPEAQGRALQDALAAAGVDWRLATTVASLEKSAAGALDAELADGGSLECDVVLSAIGLEPVTEPAVRAGLTVRRGIVVDRHLCTSTPGIHAIGDCAEVEGLVLPFIMPIMHAARALARSLAGEATPVTYPAMPVVVKTPACPTLVSPPPEDGEGAWVVAGSGADLEARFLDREGRMTGFALTGKATRRRAEFARQVPPWLA